VFGGFGLLCMVDVMKGAFGMFFFEKFEFKTEAFELFVSFGDYYFEFLCGSGFVL